MSFNAGRRNSFEDAAHKLFGWLAQLILILVLIANILAYAFSEKYRSTFPPGKFVVYTLAWAGLTVGFWWTGRGLVRSREPFGPRRPPTVKRMKDDE